MSESTHHVTPIDIDAAASTAATSPEEVLEHTIGVTVLGVSGVHALGSTTERVAGALRSAIGSGSVPGVRAGTTDDGLVVDIAVVAEYPTNVTALADTIRTQVQHAVGQLDDEPVTINVTVSDVHGPFDAEKDAADKVGDAADKAGDVADKARDVAGQAKDAAADALDSAADRSDDARDRTADVTDEALDATSDVVAGAREKAADAVDGVADAVDEAREGDATRASAADGDADVTVTVDGGTVTVAVDADSDAHVVVDGDEKASEK